MVQEARPLNNDSLLESVLSARNSLRPVEWDPQQYEGRKVIVRIDSHGEPCSYNSEVISFLKAYFFVCWRSFDESNYREYAECVASTIAPRDILLRLEEGKESRRGYKNVMIPVRAIYFLDAKAARSVGIDPHPDQDCFFPELIRVLPPPIPQPRFKWQQDDSSRRVFVTNRPSGRLLKNLIDQVSVLGRGIELRMSRIPTAGRGVYASRVFQSGELVTLYFGHLFGEAQRKHMQTHGKGSHCKPVQFKLSYLDGVKEGFLGMPAGQLLNEGGKESQNCDWISLEVYPSSGEKVIGLRAIRHIYPGEELYVSYGSKYWSEQQGKVPDEPPPVLFELTPAKEQGSKRFKFTA